VQLKRAPIQLAHGDDDIVAVDGHQTAAAIIVGGCIMAILAAILPWIEKAAFGFSLTIPEREPAGLLLGVPAVISAGVAGALLFRRPASGRIAIFLIALAVTQLGVSIWFGLNIVDAIREAQSHLVLITAIGTGAYLAILGSASTLVGSTLAWTTRRRGR
jgi:hypothetical protein